MKHKFTFLILCFNEKLNIRNGLYICQGNNAIIVQ